jgi:predicted nucleic acid-binding protein
LGKGEAEAILLAKEVGADIGLYLSPDVKVEAAKLAGEYQA